MNRQFAYKPKCGIYALVDPRDGRVMYVGQSIDIDYRYRQHIDYSHRDSNRRKAHWIGALRDLGLLPQLVILRDCGDRDPWELDEAEREEIRRFKRDGQAELNVATGGKARGSSRSLNSHPDDWLQLARKIKLIDQLMSEVGDDLCAVAPVALADRAAKHQRNYYRFRDELEAIYNRLFPDRHDSGRVFHGPIDPSEGSS